MIIWDPNLSGERGTESKERFLWALGIQIATTERETQVESSPMRGRTLTHRAIHVNTMVAVTYRLNAI